MNLEELNSGIIYTNSKCIGCNKCISSCIAVGANVVVKDEESDQYVVIVDPNKCILCGHCVEECVHEARTYRDDPMNFLMPWREVKISLFWWHHPYLQIMRNSIIIYWAICSI